MYSVHPDNDDPDYFEDYYDYMIERNKALELINSVSSDVLNSRDSKGNTLYHLMPYFIKNAHRPHELDRQNIYSKNHAGYTSVDVLFDYSFHRFISFVIDTCPYDSEPHSLASTCYYDGSFLHPMTLTRLPSKGKKFIEDVLNCENYTDRQYNGLMWILNMVPELINTTGRKHETILSTFLTYDRDAHDLIIMCLECPCIDMKIQFNEGLPDSVYEEAIRFNNTGTLLYIVCHPRLSAKIREKFIDHHKGPKKRIFRRLMEAHRGEAPFTPEEAARPEFSKQFRPELVEWRNDMIERDVFDFFALIIFHCDGFTEFGPINSTEK